MAVNGVPIFIQDGGENADDVRRMTESLLGLAVRNDGVVAAGDLAVTEKSGTPDMSVDVAAGEAFVAGDEATDQGYYHVSNDATVNLAVTASDPTNDRIDLVVCRVRDSAYSGVTDSQALEIVTGTAAASPSAPALPDNSIQLASILVENDSSTVVDADITDSRSQIVAWRPENYYTGAWNRSTTQTISNNTLTTVTFTTEEWDPAGMLTPTSGTATISVDGRYAVAAGGTFATGATASRAAFSLAVTGATVSGAVEYGAHATGTNPRGSIYQEFNLSASDTVSLQVRHTTGTDRDLTEAYLSVRYIGPAL